MAPEPEPEGDASGGADAKSTVVGGRDWEAEWRRDGSSRRTVDDPV